MAGSVSVTCASCRKVYSLPRSLTAEYRGTKNNYCSEECYKAYRSQQVTVVCEECNKPFQVWRSRYARGNVRFCSEKCSTKWRGEHLKKHNPNPSNRIKLNCEVCGKSFEEVPSRIKQNARFCSTKCYGKWRERSGISSGQKNPMYRDGSTERTMSRLRKAQWKRIADQIRAERGNKCQVCGREGKGKKLPVHHKIPWEISRDDSPTNLLIVCQSCHVRLDILYYEKGIVPY